MARSSSKDPLDKFRWLVEIPDFGRIGFTSVEIPEMEMATTEYREGGRHLFPKQIINSISYRPITLIRGVSTDKDFQNWIYDAMVKSLQSDPKDVNLVYNYRKDITINHLDRLGRTIKSYNIFAALPVGFKPASDFSADADDTYSLEKLVIKYEGFTVTSPTQMPSINSVGDLFNRLTKKML